MQRAPELLAYLQGIVDVSGRPGQFVLTGSQQFGLHDRVSQSLAGRAGFLTLLPFSAGELASFEPSATLPEALWRGFYSPIRDRQIPPHIWFADYVATYIERDVRQMVNVRDLAVFHRFVRMCAGRSAQLLNLSSLAADCGVTHNTALAWIGVLEASYLVMRLPPYHQNMGKRLTKAPKLYFLDVGLAAWLAGVREPIAERRRLTRHAEEERPHQGSGSDRRPLPDRRPRLSQLNLGYQTPLVTWSVYSWQE